MGKTAGWQFWSIGANVNLYVNVDCAKILKQIKTANAGEANYLISLEADDEVSLTVNYPDLLRIRCYTFF